MLYAFIESALTVVKSVWVTSYLFPAVAGVWLALITANIITLRDLKARLVAEVIEILKSIGEMPVQDYRLMPNWLMISCSGFVILGDDLKRRGHLTLAEAIRHCAGNINRAFHTAHQEIMAKHGICVDEGAILPDVTPKKNHEIFVEAKREGTAVLAARMMDEVEKVMTIHGDLLAVLELRTLANFIRTHEKRKHGRCTPDCPNYTRVV